MACGLLWCHSQRGVYPQPHMGVPMRAACVRHAVDCVHSALTRVRCVRVNACMMRSYAFLCVRTRAQWGSEVQ